MSIDLVYLGKDTLWVVKELPIEWLVSGPIRVAVHLANVWHKLGERDLVRDGSAYRLNNVGIFGPNEPDHPLTQWAASSSGNYSWLYFYGVDMCEEYLRRLPHMKQHGILRMLEAMEVMPEAVPEGEWTEPAFAKDVELRL